MFIINSQMPPFIRNLIVTIVSIIFFSIPFFYASVFLYNKERILYLDNEKESFEVVIARYNENLSWAIEEFPTEKVTVYNKGKNDLTLPKNFIIKKLPNIGREAHTYLYHIINNYYNLSERIFFTQGSQETEKNRVFFPLRKYKKIASTNCKNIIAAKCHAMNENISNIRLSNFKNTKWFDTFMREYDFIGFKHNFIEISKDKAKDYYGSYGAIFAVDKDKILRNDLNYYQNILNTLNNIAPIEGHYIEKLWDRVFAPNTTNNQDM